jgi:very-short-patch-repair endonuclease
MNGDAYRVVLARAAEQYGVVSRDEALAAGLTPKQFTRLQERGHVERLLPGVYRIGGSPATARQRAMAAILWLGDEALLSFLTAATLLRFDGCKTAELDVSVPRDIRARGCENVNVHRVLALPPKDRVRVDGLPCTSATRTLIDCASLLGEEALEVAFESARRMGLTSVRALERRAFELCARGRAGSSAIRALLSHQRPDERALQYRLEVKMARLLRQSDLPRPDRQFPVGEYRLDFAFSPFMHGVECEGFDYHGSRLAWKRDKRRTSYIEAHGWSLTFVSWDDVTLRPDETLRRISLALERAAA